MWIVCITSVRHVLTVNGYGGRQTKENEKSWCFKGWETLVSKLVKNGVIVSDNPMDYLLLYRNASEVYSDRVHACIPTLAFGNKARLFSNSPRIALFENAKIPDVRERLVSIEGLKEMQDKQIAFLASLLQ